MAVYKKHKQIQRYVNKTIRNVNNFLKESTNNRFYITQNERHLYKESILYSLKINDSLNKENYTIYHVVLSISNFRGWRALTDFDIITDFIEETYKKDSKGWNI